MYFYLLFSLINTSLAQISYQYVTSNLQNIQPTQYVTSNLQNIQPTQYVTSNLQNIQPTQYATSNVGNFQATQNAVSGYVNNQVSSRGLLVNGNTPVYTAQANYMYANSLHYSLHSGILQNVAASYNINQGYSNNNCYPTYSAGRRRRRAVEGLPYYQYCDYSQSNVYPELLVIVDNVLFSYLGNDVQRTAEYVLSFWNEVNNNYRNLRSPGINLSIAGIVIAQSDLPFVNVGVSSYSTNNLFYHTALDGFSKFLYSQSEFQLTTDYDIAVMMTGKNLVHDSYTSDVGGIAFTGGACKIVSNMVYSTAIVKDNGGNSGIISATHELAHVLGASHDGDPSMQSEGLLGGAECPAQYGYIMSPLVSDRNQNLFSACSQRSISYNLNSQSASCLHNYPTSKGGVRQLSRIAPSAQTGTSLTHTMTLDDQCRQKGYLSSATGYTNMCSNLICQSTDYAVWSTNIPAAEGTSCGDRMRCSNGQCVYSYQ